MVQLKVLYSLQPVRKHVDRGPHAIELNVRNRHVGVLVLLLLLESERVRRWALPLRNWLELAARIGAHEHVARRSLLGNQLRKRQLRKW